MDLSRSFGQSRHPLMLRRTIYSGLANLANIGSRRTITLVGRLPFWRLVMVSG